MSLPLEQQSAEARVGRQAHHRAAEPSYAAVVEGAEPAQQEHRLRDGRLARRLQPGEAQHVLLAGGHEVQHRAGEVHAADFRLGLLRPGAVRHLAPEADAHPRPRPPCPAGTLVGRGARHRQELQPVEADGGVVEQHPRQAGIDHGGDALYRHRGFGHVRRQDDLAARLRQQRRVLLLGRQVAVQRQHRQVALARQVVERPRRLTDFGQTGQENEYVAVALVEQPADRRRHSRGERVAR